MEAYRGLAILTTNLRNAIDAAFLRRLRFVVAFPFPDAAQRAAIWRRVFPAQTPTDGLDAGCPRPPQRWRAARSATSRSHAAFLAAEADAPVRMAHVRQAARDVYAQLEKPLTDRELAGWS